MEANADSPSVRELFQSAPLWARWSKKQDFLRLAAAVSIMQTRLSSCELDRGPSEPQGRGESSDPAARRPGALAAPAIGVCRDLLRQAREALVMGDVDGGWECLQELELLVMLPGDQLRARCFSAAEEAREKLDKWRGSAVVKLLDVISRKPRIGGEPTNPKTGPSVSWEQAQSETVAMLKEILYHLHA